MMTTPLLDFPIYTLKIEPYSGDRCSSSFITDNLLTLKQHKNLRDMSRWIVSPRCCFWVAFCATALAQNPSPRIASLSPTSGPEGSRAEGNGSDLQATNTVLFGKSPATFRVISSEK